MIRKLILPDNSTKPRHINSERLCKYLLGQRVDYTTYSLAVKEILQLIFEEKPSYICVANVHMVMESYDDKMFCEMVNAARLVTPDGMPLVWVLRRLGILDAQRVYGPTLMVELLKVCALKNIPLGLFGGQQQVIDTLVKNLPLQIPGLKIGYAVSPPFRDLSVEEEKSIFSEMISSGSKIMFIGLGCPKQEKWMARNSGQLPMPLLGVGAAFDLLAYPNRQAPLIIQKIGFEWLFRLISEPRRLWYRYLYHNPRFVIKIIQQILNEQN